MRAEERAVAAEWLLERFDLDGRAVHWLYSSVAAIPTLLGFGVAGVAIFVASQVWQGTLENITVPNVVGAFTAGVATGSFMLSGAFSAAPAALAYLLRGLTVGAATAGAIALFEWLTGLPGGPIFGPPAPDPCPPAGPMDAGVP